MPKHTYNDAYTAQQNQVSNRKSNTLGSSELVLAAVHRRPVDCRPSAPKSLATISVGVQSLGQIEIARFL